MGLWIGCWLSLTGCATNSDKLVVTTEDDSAACDTKVRADCISVTPGFVLGRITDKELIVRLERALKVCAAGQVR